MVRKLHYYTLCDIFLDLKYESIFSFSEECVSWICCNQSHIAAPNLIRSSELFSQFGLNALNAILTWCWTDMSAQYTVKHEKL